MVRLRDKLMLAVMVIMINGISISNREASITQTILIFIVWLIFWAWIDATFVSRAKLEELLKTEEEKNDN